MNLQEYQNKTSDTWLEMPQYADIEQQELMHLSRIVHGITGEAGELAEKVKKAYRGDGITVEDLMYEAGDVLYYLARLADMYGYSLDTIAQMNLDKLASRKTRNTLRGNGDTR
jgi:NTP pyrophosphatase (non-canonical NTP hydrolase)